MSQTLLNEVDQLKSDLIAEETNEQSKITALDLEIQKDFIRKAAQFFEVCSPVDDLNLFLTIQSSEIINEPYLLRLHNAFSSQGKVVTIHCLGDIV
jgi:hypothetical protein